MNILVTLRFEPSLHLFILLILCLCPLLLRYRPIDIKIVLLRILSLDGFRYKWIARVMLQFYCSFFVQYQRLLRYNHVLIIITYIMGFFFLLFLFTDLLSWLWITSWTKNWCIFLLVICRKKLHFIFILKFRNLLKHYLRNVSYFPIEGFPHFFYTVDRVFDTYICCILLYLYMHIQYLLAVFLSVAK